MKVLKDKLMFSSGREVYCFHEQVGLNLGAPGLKERISYGSDGILPVERDGRDEDDFALTDEEAIELADHMISAWTDYRDAMIAASNAGLGLAGAERN